MPVLSPPRKELFAQLVAGGKSAAIAYVDAGYRPSPSNANRLRNTEQVAARIEELIARRGVGVVVTKQWIIEKLVENATAALADGDRSAANRALELLGKEAGMFVDRSQVDVTVIPLADRLREYARRAAAAAIEGEAVPALPSPSQADGEADAPAGENASTHNGIEG